MRFWLRVLAWLLLAGLIFVTLSPINLRPISPLPVQAERAMALAVIGFVFTIAYPRHILHVALLVASATIAIELLQILSPSRHGRIIDVLVKLAGASVGLFAGAVFNRLRRRTG